MTFWNRLLCKFTVPLVGLIFSLVSPGSLSAADSEEKARVKLPPALEKTVPENLEDLKAIQAQVKKVLEKVVPCTVGIRNGGGQGSGVIVSEDGYVLTAGHISNDPDKTVTIILPDGRKVKGKTLGANRDIDSGLIKITDKGKYPFVEKGKSADLKKGQWCLAVGHPGGYQNGRTPVVRLGRILDHTKFFIRTECTLVGGDSGGPLFDLNGRVIGIHSRIGGTITANIHVPIDTYEDTWEKLAKGEVWGNMFGKSSLAYLGIKADPVSKECRIISINPKSPAEKAGLKVDDVIVMLDGKKIASFEDLVRVLGRKKPGDRVDIEVVRDEELMSLRVTLGRMPKSDKE
jgi:serine protease Do